MIVKLTCAHKESAMKNTEEGMETDCPQLVYTDIYFLLLGLLNEEHQASSRNANASIAAHL